MYQFDQLDWLARARMDDTPVRPIMLDAFYIDKYDVTMTDYSKFVAATGYKAPWDWPEGKVNAGQERWPVYNVSWDDAVAYCKWAGKRLPTEAEWEKAARGGLEKKQYAWGDDLEPPVAGEGSGPEAPKRSAYADRVKDKSKVIMAKYFSADGPDPVGSYPPNGYGLFDMGGNVWQWVADWYDRDYYPISPRTNPKGPETGTYRVLMGGGWGTPTGNGGGTNNLMGVFYRNYGPGDQTSVVVGFRCAKDAPQPQKAPQAAAAPKAQQ